MIFNILFVLLNPSHGTTEIELRSLSDASSKKIIINSPEPSVFVVFQKDCHACRKQIQNLNCLTNISNVLLIGSFSTENDLRKEYRLSNSKFTGVYGDRAFRKLFKIKENLTPQIILGKNKKYKISLGFLSCKTILDKLRKGF